MHNTTVDSIGLCKRFANFIQKCIKDESSCSLCYNIFMKKRLLLLGALLFSGCSVSEYRQAISLAQNPTDAALKEFAINKSITYAANPDKLERDMDHIKKNYLEVLLRFYKAAGAVWGEGGVKESSPKEYVKYTQNYKSRAQIDFDRGVVRVETIDTQHPKQSLQKAIVTTLLTPDDPRGVDLYSAKEVQPKGTPFLAGQVRDYDNKYVLYSWRANRFADMLIERKLRTTKVNGKQVHYVTIKMENDALDKRAAKYAPYIETYAKRYNIDRSLVYAVIETESNFNPFAISHVPAYGLMQIVPSTAGVDAMRFVKKSNRAPSKEYLFNAKNNIELGTGYLHILKYRYLKEIQNPVNREYCVISAYNTGASNVYRTFSSSKSRAISKINSMQPRQVYQKLKTSLPYSETRRYLQKVTDAKKRFIIYEG